MNASKVDGHPEDVGLSEEKRHETRKDEKFRALSEVVTVGNDERQRRRNVCVVETVEEEKGREKGDIEGRVHENSSGPSSVDFLAHGRVWENIVAVSNDEDNDENVDWHHKST